MSVFFATKLDVIRLQKAITFFKRVYCMSKRLVFFPAHFQAAGASYSSEVAVFEPGAKHTFDEGVGKNVANPTAMLMSAAKILEHVGMPKKGGRINAAVDSVLREGRVKTRDLGGFATTRQFTEAVVNAL